MAVPAGALNSFSSAWGTLCGKRAAHRAADLVDLPNALLAIAVIIQQRLDEPAHEALMLRGQLVQQLRLAQ